MLLRQAFWQRSGFGLFDFPQQEEQGCNEHPRLLPEVVLGQAQGQHEHGRQRYAPHGHGLVLLYPVDVPAEDDTSKHDCHLKAAAHPGDGALVGDPPRSITCNASRRGASAAGRQGAMRIGRGAFGARLRRGREAKGGKNGGTNTSRAPPACRSKAAKIRATPCQ